VTGIRRAAALRLLGALGTLLAVAAIGCTPTGRDGAADAALSEAPAGPRASASAAASAPAALGPGDLPSRVVIPGLGIDLPVVSGDLEVAGNPADYPLCDVAQYLTSYRFPGRPGTTTWIYAHAREGMFLPLLAASEQDDGRALVGQTVHLYSDHPRRYTYRITDVVRHATDRGLARGVPPDAGRLVLQTSEGPQGTVPKLQIAARLVASAAAIPAQALPPPQPRWCDEP
jgi:hypothetical protein